MFKLCTFIQKPQKIAVSLLVAESPFGQKFQLSFSCHTLPDDARGFSRNVTKNMIQDMINSKGIKVFLYGFKLSDKEPRISSTSLFMYN